jgi:hypothetical protein
MAIRTPEQITEARRIFELLADGKKITAKGTVISVKRNMSGWHSINYTIATEKGLLAWFSTNNCAFKFVNKNDYVEVEFEIKGKKEGCNNAFFVFGKRPKLIIHKPVPPKPFV